MADEEEIASPITQYGGDGESGGGEADITTTTIAAAEDPSPIEGEKKKAWHETISHDLQRTACTALRSARSIEFDSSAPLRTLKDFLPQLKTQFQTYEDVLFKKIKDEIMSAREHPAAVGGVALTGALLLMRGPRRLLYRNTLGRFQSEEARYIKAEKSVNELNISVSLMKKESAKLLERVALAKEEMLRGTNELKSTGSQIQRFTRSSHKVETQAADLMEELREIPTREALQLRAEVASMASALKQQRTAHEKRIMNIADLGVPV